MAGAGPIRCRREPIVSPITWSAGGRGADGRLGGAKVAGLTGRFRSTRLRGRWRGNGRPRAPQTVVGEGCAGAQLLPGSSFLGKECSLDREEEGVEWSLILLGMNCLKAAD